MKKGNIIYQLPVAICILVVLLACNGVNINMKNKEKLLMSRVQEMCSLMERGKFRETRIFFIPQIQNAPEMEWKEHISSDHNAEGIIDFYKIKNIEFRDGIAEILIESSFLKDIKESYDYWIFTKNNWYMVDMGRTNSVSSEELEKYKKLIKDDQK